MSPIKELESMQELTKVMEDKSDKLSVVKFYTSFCRCCFEVQAKYVKEATAMKDSADFYQVEIEDVQDAAKELGITYMPTFIAFRSGKQLGRYVGIKEQGLRHFLLKAQGMEVTRAAETPLEPIESDKNDEEKEA